MILRKRVKKFFRNDVLIAKTYFGLIVLLGIMAAIFLQAWIIGLALVLAIIPGVGLHLYQIVAHMFRREEIDFGYMARGYLGTLILGVGFFVAMFISALMIRLIFGHPFFDPLSNN